jgi:hypothetical protein
LLEALLNRAKVFHKLALQTIARHKNHDLLAWKDARRRLRRYFEPLTGG